MAGTATQRHPAFDLSRARPGDRLVISDHDLMRMGRDGELELRGQLVRLAERGVRFERWRDECAQEYVLQVT